MRFLPKLKKELFYFRKAVFAYRAGGRYLWNRYFIAPKILRSAKVCYPINAAPANVSIHVLTGRADLAMCLWSLSSFFTNSAIRGEVFVHNDGSLRPKDASIINKIFPGAKIVSEASALKNGRRIYGQYPKSYQLRASGKFVLLKKLLDPLAVSQSEMILVLDSDVVWFSRPLELEEAVSAGLPHPLMMQNHGPNYVRFTDGSTLADDLALFNSGIVAFRPAQFVLARLEEYFNKLDLRLTSNQHFIEQAGYAYALDGIQSLPLSRYTIKERYFEGVVVRHYTSPRRALFYLEALPRLNQLLRL
jgi:hypothetical protein